MAHPFRSIPSAPPPDATRRAKEILVSQLAIKHVIETVTGEPVRLLEVVASGPYHWRLAFMRAFRGYPGVDEGIAMVVFKYFCEIVVSLYGDMPAGEVLDAIEVESHRPPTEREIEDAWEVDSFSSEDGRRYFYGTDHPEQVIKRLVH